MMNGKQRSYLKGLAQNIDPTVYIGKQGITDNVIKEMETGFDIRELVKVKLQEGCFMEAKDAANEIVRITGAEFVQAIGRKFVLYRQSRIPENRKIVIPKK